ncbi:hypothetical protein GCM10009741_12540 [Kribbella lupini]|uniref:Uncharacterized protein n=1 Tax=Kribbella lupini TaxID=291602 RepID=A0ABN2ABM1_9ACTN
MPRLPPVTSTDLATNTSPHIGTAAGRTLSPAPGRAVNRAAEGAAYDLLSGVFQAETDLQADLVVVDLVVDDVAADLGHLEPVEVP